MQLEGRTNEVNISSKNSHGSDFGSPPKSDEIEITLFGSGVGESMCIHLGYDTWVIVDSCMHKESGLPASIKYLNDRGVSLDNVKLLVLTHWHSDHIRGSSEILKRCKNAQLAISAALKNKELFRLIERFREVSTPENGIKELDKILAVITERENSGAEFNQITLASEDKRLLYDPDNSIAIFSHTPTAMAELSAHARFADILMPEVGKIADRLPNISPNNTSVVLRLEIQDRRILLGADLENNNEKTLTWGCVSKKWQQEKHEKAEVFKVSHHGSHNGHNEDIWENVLKENAVAVLTPYRAQKIPLPREEDIIRLKSKTAHLYITCGSSTKIKKRNPSIDRFIRESVVRITRASGEFGFIKLQSAHKDHFNWKVSLHDSAKSL